MLFLVSLTTTLIGYSQITAKCIYGFPNGELHDIASNKKGVICFVGEKTTKYDNGSPKKDFRVVAARRNSETNKYTKINSVTYNRWSKGVIYKTTKDMNCIVSMFNDTSFIAVYNRLSTTMNFNSNTNNAAYSGWKSMPKCVTYVEGLKKCVGLLEFDNHVYKTDDGYNSVYAFQNNKENTGIVESDKRWGVWEMYGQKMDRAVDLVADEDNYIYIMGRGAYKVRPEISSLPYEGFTKQITDKEGKYHDFIATKNLCPSGITYKAKTAKYSAKEKSIYYITKNIKSGAEELHVKNVDKGQIGWTKDRVDLPGPKFSINLTENGFKSKFKFNDGEFRIEIHNNYIYMLSRQWIDGKQKFYVHKLTLEGKLVDEKELKLTASEKIKAKCKEVSNNAFNSMMVTDFVLVEDGHFAFVGYTGYEPTYGMTYVFPWK